ncbi:hypothetical protein H6P81_005533 [Aristolochia fimbriata]|uniref:HpcH/HpaI aldolase/citrate lyase domain-containing protein n=1 Tax=Aristolochia fimbriata TaxID=158543 RepID=A0AAV7EVW7_ARIFI|nr:hypothetical protein H6P81_005533 [Aristolochia fimbriata]
MAAACGNSIIFNLKKPLASPSLSAIRNPYFPLGPSLSKPPRVIPLRSNVTANYSAPKSSSASDLSLTPDDPISSRPKTLKSRLADGEILYGIFLLGFSPTLAEIAGLAGYDFAVVDMEHGHGGISDALPCIRALAATGTPAVLRLPESSADWAKKALDIGPQGIMFPMIESPKAAKKAVSYCRFPPDGVRGSAHTIVRASRYGIDDGYLENYKNELLIMCQVETKDGVEKIDEIAEVEGVDCVQMGPLDLSASVGYLWDPGNKKVREVLRAAEKGVLGTGKAYLGSFAMPHDPPEAQRSRGYHMISGAVDLGLFRSAALEDVRKFKSWKDSPSDDESDKDKDEKYWSE